jgi:biopolymer transport protein ExbD
LLPTKKHDDRDLIDMTAMVDVTFFLLIFFMVTSMAAVQSSIALPTPEATEGTRGSSVAVAPDDDQVVVRIEADNTVLVDDEDAPSRQDVIGKLRDSDKASLVVFASGEARHGTVVMVLDAGSDAGMDQIRLVSEDEL